MKWRFSKQRSDQVESEITQRDQFNNDEVKISETIVREAIQNSLDAAVNDPINISVRFKWVDKKTGLDPHFFRSLFDKQFDHAKLAGLDVEALDFENPSALVIEDFGTCGLEGAVDQWDENHFSDFWRRHGKSHKTGKSRGRWGLGKLVYSATSEIGAFFGVTLRSGEKQCQLMGQTVLNLRTIENERFPAHAFFSDYEHEESDENRINVPIKDYRFVEDFIANFCLERGQSPGLSVVIPFPDRKFNLKHMLGVAVENYFYPLITGQLTLKFNDIEINSSNVREMAKEYASERFDQIDILFDFIEDIYTAEQGTLLKIKPSWLDDKKLDENDFPPETLDEIRKKFACGDLVGLHLPVFITLKNGEKKESRFAVYIKRPADLEKGLDLYVRGGLTLPGEAKFQERRALGAVIAEDEIICSFLGDAENAAHTQWTTNTEKLREKYRNSQPVVTVIKNSARQLYDLLAETVDEKDEDALLDFFWFEEPDQGKKKKRKQPKVEPKLVITSNKPLIDISKIDGGFSLTNTEHFSQEKLPREIAIEVAYEIGRGNSFKKYSHHDFTVGKGGGISVVKTESVRIVTARENSWKFVVNALPFKLQATGFDGNRDLKIKVS